MTSKESEVGKSTSYEVPPADAKTIHFEPSALTQAIVGHQPLWARNFDDLTYEWRRLFAEITGTFLLVVVAAGGGIEAAMPRGIGRDAAVVAPGLMVMALILAIGAMSGAHLNPAATVAFALRREFPWKRVPAYLAAQVTGGLLAALFLWAMFGRAGAFGQTLPGPGFNDLHAMAMEALLTFGLVKVILGTASGAQNVGSLSAIAVGGYVALAGLWASPVSGASMNPVRSLAPAVISGHFAHLWVYFAGPAIGMLVAVGAAYVLRGPGADPTAARAAQGTLGTIVIDTRASMPDPSPVRDTRD